MKNFLRIIILTIGLGLFIGGPTAVAAEKIRAKIVFDHKYEKKYNCTARLETLRLFVPLMNKEFKAELTEYYVALGKAIEEAQASFNGETGEIAVSEKGIDSILTVKENGLMDVKMNLPTAWLTLQNVTIKDLKKVFEKYLKC